MIYRLVDPITLSRLRNDEHFLLHTECIRIIDEAGASPLDVVSEFEIYRELFRKVDDAQLKIVKSDLTEKILEADRKRDDIYRGLVDQTRSYKRHPLQTHKDAATRLSILFDTYGNVTRKTYNAQTAAIINLVQDLSGNYRPDVEFLGLDIWVEQLEALNGEVDALTGRRYDQNAGKSEVSLRDAREELDAAYYVIIERINAGVIAYRNVVPYPLCVRLLNEVLLKYNNTITRRSGGKLGTKHKKWSHGFYGETIAGDTTQDYGEIPEYEEPADPDIEYDLDSIEEYNPDKHWTEYQLGDLVKHEGIVFRVKDLGQIHYPPYSKLGPLGWERMN